MEEKREGKREGKREKERREEGGEEGSEGRVEERKEGGNVATVKKTFPKPSGQTWLPLGQLYTTHNNQYHTSS